MPTLAENMAWLKANGIKVEQCGPDRNESYAYLSKRPKSDILIEVGVYQGGSLLLLSEFVKPGGLIIGVDTFVNHEHDKADRLPYAEAVAVELRKRGFLVELFVGPSAEQVGRVREYVQAGLSEVRAAHASEEIRMQLRDKPVRVPPLLWGSLLIHLHIDADHSYPGVRRDYELYAPLVKSGGLIQLHDAKNSNTGVPRLWREVHRYHPGAVKCNHAGMLPVP